MREQDDLLEDFAAEGVGADVLVVGAGAFAKPHFLGDVAHVGQRLAAEIEGVAVGSAYHLDGVGGVEFGEGGYLFLEGYDLGVWGRRKP